MLRQFIKKFLPYIILFGVAIFVIVFDLVSKSIVAHKMELGQQINFIKGFISFCYVKNTGAAWSIFAGKQIFLILITIFFLIIMTIYYIKERSKSILFNISCGMILGGSIGNLVDRIFLGYVRDFINLDFMNFPVFNIADSALTVGVGLFIVYLIITFIKSTKREKTSE